MTLPKKEEEPIDGYSVKSFVEYDVSNLVCLYCGKEFLEYKELRTHVNVHFTQNVINFIKENQPVGGRIITSKFKSFDLYDAEKNDIIKFSDKNMGWVLPDYTADENKIPTELKTDSIHGAPCIDCKFEKTCSIDDFGEGNPLTCELISSWVSGKSKKKKLVETDFLDSIKTALFFCQNSKKFSIVGKIEKNENSNSANKFVFIDAENTTVPIVMDYDDEKELQSSMKIKITNARLSGHSKPILQARRHSAKIEITTRVERKEAEKQWVKDHEMTDSELEQYIKDTKDTQKYDDDGNLRSEAKKLHVRNNQSINKLLEKEPEIIQTISREMVTEYLNHKRTIDKSLKIKLIDEYRIHKSVAKVIELHSATGSTRREGKIKRHLVTGLRLPAELRKIEEEGGLHPNHECSIKIALFATDHFNWDGQKNKEKDVVNLAVAISEYLQSDLELNQIFQEEKRSEEVIIRSKKRDEIHEKYEVKYSSGWQRGDRTLPQYWKLHGSKNLEVIEFLCKWEFKHKNRLPFRIADALLDNPEEALEKYKDELL